MDRLTDLERKLIKVQKSAKTLFPVFNRPHNWLRMKSRPYYLWHLQPIAGLSHYLVVGVYSFVVVALIAGIISYNFLPSSVHALATNIWTFDDSGDYSYDSNKVEITDGVAQLRCEGGCTPGTDWIPANANGNSSGTNWSYRKSITVNAGQVTGTLTDFPMLVSLTDNDLRTTANGGYVGSSTGADIAFTSSDRTTVLSHEIESYNASTGTVVSWVKVPSLTTGTVIYMYYGNASYNGTLNANKTSVWTNYKSVWHLPNGSTLSASDSTANGHNGTISSATATTGKIDGGATGFGSIEKSSYNAPLLDATYEIWVNTSSASTDQAILLGYGSCHLRPLSIISSKFQFRRDCYSGDINSTTTVQNGTWYHVAITISSSGVKKMYVNGVEEGTNSATTGSTTSETATFRVGSTQASAAPFLGTLDEVKVSTKERSASWILAEYNNQGNPSTFYSVSGQSQLGYPTDYPTITNNVTHDYLTLPGFAVTTATGSEGTIKFQISPDNGTTWYWYNSGWTTTANSSGSAGYVNANTAADINTHITSFTAGSGTRQFKWRAFLASNGSEQPRIDTISLHTSASWDITSSTTALSDANKLEYSSGIAQLQLGDFGAYTPGTNWIADSGGQSWNYRKLITFDNSANGSELTNYQVRFTIDTTTLISAGKLQADCDDLRFTTSNGVTTVDYAVESGCNSGSTVVWVEVPTLPASSSTSLYLYYGNSAVSAGSSLANTFALPMSVSAGNLVSWLKADAGTTLSGSTVSAWADQSGNNNNFSQGTASAQPTLVSNAINGQPVLRFDGSNDRLASTTSLSLSNTTMYFVTKVDSFTLDHRFASNITGCANSFGTRFTSSNKFDFWGGWTTMASGLSTATNYVLGFTKNSTTVTAHVNGAAQASVTDSSGRSLTGTWEIGGNYCGNGSYFDGDVAEWIVYNTSLSTSDKSKIERYLAAKYGIAITAEYAVSTSTGSEAGLETYATDNPYVTLSTGQAFSSVSAFSPTLGSGSTGTIRYQLSPNDGTTWYYHNGTAWTSATTGTYAHTNTVDEINQYIGSFNDIEVDGTKTLKWRAYFNSNGSTLPKLDSVAINYYTPPSAPTSGAANSITTTSITWTWTDNSTTEGQFKILNGSDNSELTTVTSNTVGTTGTVYTYEETGLSVNTQYSRIIKATDGTEDGSGVTITAYTLANTPTAPTLSANDTAITVTLGINSNPANTTYVFGVDNNSDGSVDSNSYVQSDGTLGASAAWQTYASWGGASGKSVSGLTPNTTYRFIVKARNGDNTETAFSSPTSTLTLASVPAAPTVTAVTSTSLRIVINENSNPATVEYALWNDTSAQYLQTNGTLGDTAVWRSKVDWGGASGVVNTGLAENTTYTYKVKARNSAGTETALSNGASRATPVAPTPPESVTIKDTSDLSKVNNFELSVQWEAVNIASLDYYILERSTDGTTFSEVTTTTNQFYRDTGLTAGTYYYRVKTHTDLPDVSSPSDIVSATVGPDTVAPIISSVTATVVNDTKAVITWVTDETATSTVEYGTTTDYGNESSDTTLTSAIKRRHTVTITGLTPSTTYHFRVKSADSSGNTTTSDDFTFATTDSPVDTSLVTATISEVTQSSNESDQVSSSAKIVWATSEPGDSFVEIGPTTSYGSVYGRFESVTLHTVVVTGLQPNTTYNYRVRSTNARGQTTVSANQTLVTGSVAKPTITDVQVSDIDLTGAVISWRTPDKPATTKVQWGTNEDTLNQESTEDLSLDTNHRVALSDLKSGTKYYFRVISRDTENVATYQSVLFSFETLAAPTISSYRVDAVSDKDATILITTNTDTDVVLSYSTQTDVSNAKQQTTGQFVKTHTIRLTDLTPDTTYTARIQARDKFGNATTSGIFNITTARDNYAPEFVKITTEVNAVGLGDNARAQAIIATTLNESAKKMTVRYGLGIAPTGNEQTLAIEPGSNYGVLIVKDLPLAATIHYRVEVEDMAGNVTMSEWKSFPTPQSQASILNIILKQLTDTFGIFNFGVN